MTRTSKVVIAVSLMAVLTVLLAVPVAVGADSAQNLVSDLKWPTVISAAIAAAREVFLAAVASAERSATKCIDAMASESKEWRTRRSASLIPGKLAVELLHRHEGAEREGKDHAGLPT